MAHPDLDALLNVLLPFAQQSLKKQGEFYPFGALIDNDGNPECVMAQPTGIKHPQSQEIIDTLTAGFRDKISQDGLKATGICFDGKVIPPGQSGKSDAICFKLEHVSGEAVDVFVPYRKGLFGKIKYDALFASQGIASIFIED